MTCAPKKPNKEDEMLRVTIELVPYGVTEETELLCVGSIINDGSGTVASGNYIAVFSGCDEELGAVEIRGFDRRNKDSLELLYECLKAVYE